MTDDVKSIDDVFASIREKQPDVAPEKEAAPVSEAPPVEVATAPMQEAPEKADDAPPNGWTYAAYKDEKTKRQEFEQKWQEAERQRATYENELRKYQQQTAQQPPVNMFEDPDAFVGGIQSQFHALQQQMVAQRAEFEAVTAYGAQKVKEARDFVLERANRDPSIAARLNVSANPWSDAVGIMDEIKLRDTFGNDPEAARQKIIADYLASTGQTPPQAPQAPQKPTLVLPSNIAAGKGEGRGSAPIDQLAPLNDIFRRVHKRA